MKPCPKLKWIKQEGTGGMHIYFGGDSSVINYYWDGGDGGYLCGYHTWFLLWRPDYKRWLVRQWGGDDSKPAAFAKTEEEAKEFAELAHQEAWDAEYNTESLKLSPVERLLSLALHPSLSGTSGTSGLVTIKYIAGRLVRVVLRILPCRGGGLNGNQGMAGGGCGMMLHLKY